MKKQNSEGRDEDYVNRKWGVPLYRHFNPSKAVRAECAQLATPSFNPFWLVRWHLNKVILVPRQGFWACDLAPWQSSHSWTPLVWCIHELCRFSVIKHIYRHNLLIYFSLHQSSHKNETFSFHHLNKDWRSYWMLLYLCLKTL